MIRAALGDCGEMARDGSRRRRRRLSRSRDDEYPRYLEERARRQTASHGSRGARGPFRRSLLPLASFVLAAGCLPYDPVERAAPPLDVPAEYASGGEAVEEPEELRRGWWVAFGDPRLSDLVGRTLSSNFQLHAAWARLEQARAVAELAGAPHWPQVGLELSAGRQRQRFGEFPPQEFNTFAASIPASYELDLFARIGAEATAAELDARAARLDVEALAMTLAAQLAEAWFDLADLSARRALLEQQLETNGTFLELIQLRFETGIASALDVYQQQQQVVATRAQLTLIVSQERVRRNQIAVLAGVAPRSLSSDGPVALPDLPPLPDGGVPLAMIQQRPDLRAAQVRVSAADYRVGAAIADWFPRLTVRGSVGVSGQELSELFDLDSLVWSILGAVTQTIIDGGRRSAEIDRRQGIVYERLAGYGQAFLTAVSEVDNAVSLEAQQRENIAELERQIEIAGATLREARNRYREGLTDFLNVLTALTSLHNAQLALQNARRQLVSHRIQLVRALGGSWSGELVPPERLEPAEMEGSEED